MKTYQDYLAVQGNPGQVLEFVRQVINEHKTSAAYLTALDADEYDAERNVTIREFMKFLYSGTGEPLPDTYSSNTKLTSNFFARLNTQRCTYSLGNGLIFQAGDMLKKLGDGADKKVKDAGYYALIHGETFLFWAYDHIRIFKLTEFAPLVNEQDGSLGAGVRFWQVDPKKPLYATLYTPDGFIDYESEHGNTGGLAQITDIQAYRMTVRSTPATTGDIEEADNYGSLPIIPLFGSRLQQSTLVGMRSKIDAYDMVHSGFANDLQDCAQIYWLISGAGGMNEKDLKKFRERILYRHIANVPNSDEVTVTPYTQEPPYMARKELLESLRTQIYEDFGGLDVHSVSADSTNDHLAAAYQPLDENADDFEYQVTVAIQRLLALQGVSPEEAEPQYKRNRISNQMEQVQMLALERPDLDEETYLNHLPNISPEEVKEILKRKAAEDLDRVSWTPEDTEDGETGLGTSMDR